MAEGGVAAALANVDTRDNWKVHFRDTMRGGKFLNQWRMAQIHAQEAPARVRELEEWGAVFDRTKDGRILQRNFGGHTYPRLAHVGDRTGLEMIRTLQDKGVHQGIDVHMECTIRWISKGRRARVPAASAISARVGGSSCFKAKAVVLATGGIGRCWEITSNSWEYTADGHAMAMWAGADLIDMEFVQFHPTGMVWPPSVRGTLITEGVRGEGGVLLNGKGKRFMFDYIPDMFKGEFAESEEEAQQLGRGDDRRRAARRAASAGAVDARRGGPGDPPRDSRRPRLAARRRVPGYRLASHGRGHQEEAAQHVSPVQGAGGRGHHDGADGSRPDVPLHDGRRPRQRRNAGVDRARFVRRGRSRRRHARGQPAGRQLAFRLAGVRQAGRRVRGARRLRRCRFGQINQDEVERVAAESLRAFGDGGRARTRTRFTKNCASAMQSLVGIVRTEEDLQAGPRENSASSARGRRRRKVGGNIQYNPGWHLALDLKNMLDISEAVTRAALERNESRGAHTREDFPDTEKEWGKVNVIVRQTRDGIQVVREPLPEMPAELQELVKKE